MGLMLNPVGIDVEPRWGSCHEVGCVPGVRCATPGYVLDRFAVIPPSAFAKLVKLLPTPKAFHIKAWGRAAHPS